MRFKRTYGEGRKSFDKILKESENHEGRVGWDKSAVYHDTGIPVAEVAATQEYGDPAHNIPQRSFFRTTIEEKRIEWKDKMTKLSKMVLNGKLTVKDALETLVLISEGDVVEKITTLQEPPLADSTIAARLHKRKDKQTVGNLTKPLVDSGYMLSTFISTVDGVKVSRSK